MHLILFQLYDRVYRPYEGKPLYTCVASLLQPRGRGEVTLNSTDPYDDPNINPNYYIDERDLKDVVEGQSYLIIRFFSLFISNYMEFK